VTFSVYSPFGISNAVIERAGRSGPTAVVLRLLLKGLENVRSRTARSGSKGRSRSGNGKPVVAALEGRQGDTPPATPTVRTGWKSASSTATASGEGDTAQGGYFEMPVAQSALRGNPKRITVSWIDFYRN